MKFSDCLLSYYDRNDDLGDLDLFRLDWFSDVPDMELIPLLANGKVLYSFQDDHRGWSIRNDSKGLTPKDLMADDWIIAGYRLYDIYSKGTE